MEGRHLTSLTRTLGALTSRRPLFSAIVGTGAALALGSTGQTEDEHEMGSQPAANAESPIPVNLVAKIAGEDLVNDWIKVVSEPEMLTIPTAARRPIDVGATIPSEAIDSSRFRSYSAMAVGRAGPVRLRLEVSPDGGATWFWHPRGESVADQYPVQTGELVAPLCRLLLMNSHSMNQEVDAWLVLAR